MASPIELASSLLVNRTEMDPSKGVSEKALAAEFKGILDQKVAEIDTDVASDKDVKTDKDVRMNLLEMTDTQIPIVLPEQVVPMNLNARIEIPKEIEASTSRLTDQVVRVEDKAIAQSQTESVEKQIAQIVLKDISRNIPQEVSARLAPQQGKEAPTSPKEWARFVGEGDSMMNSNDSSQDLLTMVKEAPKKEGDFSPPMDLKTLSESLYVQKNLLNVNSEGLSFSSKLEEFTASQSSDTIRPQVMKEMEPLVQQVRLTNTGGEMTIQLKPANMGAVRVDVQVEGDLVKVNFQAEQSSTRVALQAQSQDLKQQLQQSGLKVDHVHVGAMSAPESAKQGDSGNWQQPQQGNQQQSNAQHQQQAKHQGRERDFHLEAELKEQSL